MANNLSQRENNILLGMILGDAHVRQLKHEARIEVTHTADQKDYLFWKYENLKRWVISKPRLVKIYDKRFNKVYSQWRFRTKSHKVFSILRNSFYPKGKKIIPQKIESFLKSPLSLAVWFMDDGGRRNDCYGVFLNTLSFTKAENKILRKCLKRNFSLNSRIHWVQDGYRLYIPSKNIKHFSALVYPYIVPSMTYKLPFNPVTTEFAQLDRARDRK